MHIFIPALFLLATVSTALAQPLRVSAVSPGKAGAPLKANLVSAPWIVPSSGMGVTQTFNAKFTSAAVGGVRHAYIWFSEGDSTASGANSCLIDYASEFLPSVAYLASDDGSSWIPVFFNTGNSQCSIAFASMDNFVGALTVTLTFQPSFAGDKKIWIRAVDADGDTGWQLAGTWKTTNPPPGQAMITARPMVPDAGSGYSSTSRFWIDDSNGSSDLLSAQIWFTPSGAVASDANTCKIRYDIGGGSVQLRNDAGTDWLSGWGQGSNRQCSVGAHVATERPLPNRLVLTPSVTFAPEFWAISTSCNSE